LFATTADGLEQRSWLDGQTGALRRWINFSISIAREGVSIFNATPARVSQTITATESSHAND
jgi:hypothetical protein